MLLSDLLSDSTLKQLITGLNLTVFWQNTLMCNRIPVDWPVAQRAVEKQHTHHKAPLCLPCQNTTLLLQASKMCAKAKMMSLLAPNSKAHQPNSVWFDFQWRVGDGMMQKVIFVNMSLVQVHKCMHWDCNRIWQMCAKTRMQTNKHKKLCSFCGSFHIYSLNFMVPEPRKSMQNYFT